MEESNSPQSKSDKDAPAPKKRSWARKLLILLILGLMIGTFVVGTLLGPRFLTKLPWPKHADAAAAEKEEPPSASVAILDPIVVDLRESSGEVHHLKVGIALELQGSVHGEEFKRYEPRARDAAITMFRALTFEEATNPTRLEHIRGQLGERIAAAIGRGHVRKILFTEFVAQ
ncbi:MAG: flagellar basal body-associated FliL family protein [Deltaproteobacteria bacterium]|nr:flagellar basal body-associated FliL family protein [Deltaproteobacteria bacterium]